MPTRVTLNRHVLPRIQVAEEPVDTRAFHASFPEYQTSDLVLLPRAAAELGLAQVWAKDESRRMGLGSFKVLGASWGAARVLSAPRMPTTLAALEQRTRKESPTVVAATEGNHGEAVAFIAKRLGLPARIHVPSTMEEWRGAAITAQGAELVTVEGTYDDALRSAMADNVKTLIISDAAWPGYEQVPRWIAEGYATLFAEIDEQLAAQGEAAPDLVLVPMGVGSLAEATVRHYRARASGAATTRVVGVEPERAACVFASIERGEVVTVPGPYPSVMAGLNCGAPSSAAWPTLRAGLAASIAIPDDRLRWARAHLASAGIDAGPAGAAGLAGLAAVALEPELREEVGLTERSRALVLVTEGGPTHRGTVRPPALHE